MSGLCEAAYRVRELPTSDLLYLCRHILHLVGGDHIIRACPQPSQSALLIEQVSNPLPESCHSGAACTAP